MSPRDWALSTFSMLAPRDERRRARSIAATRQSPACALSSCIRGTLPHVVAEVVDDVACVVPGTPLGLHTQNYNEHVVANTLAALRAGGRQIQRALNGLRERCGSLREVWCRRACRRSNAWPRVRVVLLGLPPAWSPAFFGAGGGYHRAAGNSGHG